MKLFSFVTKIFLLSNSLVSFEVVKKVVSASQRNEGGQVFYIEGGLDVRVSGQMVEEA